MNLPKSLQKMFLMIDGVVMVTLGAFIFLTLAGLFAFGEFDYGWKGILWSIIIVIFTLFLVVSGVALVRRHYYGGMIAGVLFVLGIVATLTQYILHRDILVLVFFFMWIILTVFLVLGWNELR